MNAPHKTPDFLSPRWCDRAWTAFVPFGADRALFRTIPAAPGLYRVRVAGHDQLAYVGQTGHDLRHRVSSLARGVLADEMPWNDPHTAAPKLWSFRTADGLRYEVSVTPCDLPKNDRMGLECLLVWRYRAEAGSSPLCNFGRLHPRYVTSRNRSTGARGRRLADDEPDTAAGLSMPALALRGTPGGSDWMGLAWSARAPLTATGLSGVPVGPGVYQIADEAGQVLYIGQSTVLLARLRTHARDAWPGPVFHSFAALPQHTTPTQLLEVENDLIAGFYARTGHAPALQFGAEAESPAD